jgi:uncharacterized protein
MRVVLDTNIVVSALLWHGPPRQVLDAARAAAVTPFTPAMLLAELQDVLGRPEFADRLVQAGVTAENWSILANSANQISTSPHGEFPPRRKPF